MTKINFIPGFCLVSASFLMGAFCPTVFAESPPANNPIASTSKPAKTMSLPPGVFHGSIPWAPSAALIEKSKKVQAAELSGQSLFVQGDINSAILAFQEALTYEPADITAYRGLANCYLQLGDTQKALEAERGAVYIKGSGDTQPVIVDTNTSDLLQLASLLDKTGQTAEAVTIYNHAAMSLKYIENKPNDVYLLPLFGTEQGQIAYTPARLQALVQVGLGAFSLYTQGLKPAERVVHLREAARLYPDSPVVQSYLGDVLAGAGDAAGAKAARAQANALDISRVRGLLDAQTAIMQEEKGVQ